MKTDKRPLTPSEQEECHRLKVLYEAIPRKERPSQLALGVTMGMSQGAVSHYINGRNPLNLSVAVKFAKALSLQVQDFSPRLAAEAAEIGGVVSVGVKDDAVPNQDAPTLEPGPPVRSYRPAPVIGTAQLGPDGYWDAIDYPVGHGEGYIDVPTRDPNAYALRVRGDSMAPTIRNGWLVVIEPNSEAFQGELVLVCDKSGRCMVKEYLYERDGCIALGSINQDVKPISLHKDEITRLHHVGFIVPPSKIRLA